MKTAVIAVEALAVVRSGWRGLRLRILEGNQMAFTIRPHEIASAAIARHLALTGSAAPPDLRAAIEEVLAGDLPDGPAADVVRDVYLKARDIWRGRLENGTPASHGPDLSGLFVAGKFVGSFAERTPQAAPPAPAPAASPALVPSSSAPPTRIPSPSPTPSSSAPSSMSAAASRALANFARSSISTTDARPATTIADPRAEEERIARASWDRTIDRIGAAAKPEAKLPEEKAAASTPPASDGWGRAIARLQRPWGR